MKKLKNFTICVLIAVVFSSGVSLSKNNDISYITDSIKTGNIKVVVNATGEVGAINMVSVGAQVSGKIEKLYVELGQKVKKGDIIAQIDSTTQENELAINLAKLESYKAQLEAAKTNLSVATSQYEREKKLYKSNATSKEGLENIKNEYANAKSSVSDLKSMVKQTEISVATARTNVGYTKITSPIDGIVVSSPVKEGQTVNSVQSAPTIVQVADLSQMEILMEISEGDITKVKPGQRVTFNVLSNPNKQYETTIKSVDPGLTTLTNGEYTGVVGSDGAIYYYSRLVVPNEDGNLRIGMTTQNIIYVSNAENVLLAPISAIGKEDNKSFVRTLEKGKEKKVEVKTGASDNINIEIKNGLKEGDIVIISDMSAQEMDENMSSRRRRGMF